MSSVTDLSPSTERKGVDLRAALAGWYADRASIRRLWAAESEAGVVVLVAVQPSVDGDDMLPAWLASAHARADEREQFTDRDVQLQLVAPEFQQSHLGAETTVVADLSCSDSWES